MKKERIIRAAVIILIITSCGAPDSKVPQMAIDMCNCLTAMEKEMNPEAKAIISRSAAAAEPKKELTDAIMNLSTEQQKNIGPDLRSIKDIEDTSTKVGKCLKDVERKYDDSYTTDKTKTAERHIEELESKAGCNFTASLMKLGLKLKENK